MAEEDREETNTLSPQEQKVLVTLRHIRNNLTLIVVVVVITVGATVRNASLETAIEMTGPGGSLYMARQEALESLSSWQSLLHQARSGPAKIPQ
ncbi:MAG: hypothetical protein DHS80DRAFT_33120 [Piptocephalis tieghemiana]|nr:MAG: hypothetical protein DHS80DRAFT_33120 [Piptocephalis tieghemiana]